MNLKAQRVGQIVYHGSCKWKRAVCLLYILLLVAGLTTAQTQDFSDMKDNRQACQENIIVTYPPAMPSVKFANIYGDNDIAITSFEAKRSRLKEAYIWIHEKSSGMIGVHLSQGAPYGQITATGTVSGDRIGKQQIIFSGPVYLEKGKKYYLKLFKGEPATVRGAVAATAKEIDDVEGYNTYGPLSSDIAHELVFDEWVGSIPKQVFFDERKKFSKEYEASVNRALHSQEDLFGHEILTKPEGPTYENIKGYLTPLKLIGTAVSESGVYYLPFGRPLNLAGYGPVALHLGDGSQIVSQVSSGDKTTIWIGVEGDERYGFAEARLAQENLEDGYQPVLVNSYIDQSGIIYIQESFSDYTSVTDVLTSFVKLTVRKGKARINKVKVRLLFTDKALHLEGNLLKSNNKVRAVLTRGGIVNEGNVVTYELDLDQGDQVIYMARLLHPADCLPFEMDADYYEKEKIELKDFWNSELNKGAVFEVPETIVNNARKALLIQNLFMGYLYSIGNIYQTWFQPEGNDAALVLGEYGFLKHQKAMQEMLLSVPFRQYPNWEMGELLSHAAQYYYISKDTSFIQEHKLKFIHFMENFKKQMNESPNGVLNAEAFSGDIPERLVYLHHQAVAWRGLRDMANVLAGVNGAFPGSRYLSLADSLQARLLRGLDKNKTSLPDSSIFFPTELFTKEKPNPYIRITETKYGSYWNLCFPYVAGSGLLDDHSMSSYYGYLKKHGAFLLGMVRFNYYPVSVGEYRRDGLPGYKTAGVDNVYGLNMARLLVMADDPDYLVLSLYAKLAHGMTRNTFISGEGDTVGPYPGEYYRTSYMSPSSFNNSWFLLMLRLMLVAEIENEKGVADKLRLAYATPRAWLEQGKEIVVKRAPTLFGEISYQIRSEIDQNKIYITVNLPDQAVTAKEISIRLRTPGNRTIKSVRLNGKSLRSFDAAKETIDLAGEYGLLNLTVIYK